MGDRFKPESVIGMGQNMHTHLGTHRGTYLVPAIVYSLRLQLAADLMHQVVGQQRNEDMPFNPLCQDTCRL